MPSIFARTAFTDGIEVSDCLVKVADGVIVSVAPYNGREELPADTLQVDCLAPGFIDIHINGGEEFHFTQSPTRAALLDMIEASRRTGTPYILPTCITSSWGNIRAAITAVRAFRVEFPDSGVIGVHIEGPFINPRKKGAHLESMIQPPANELLDELVEAAKHVPILLTLAPELFFPEQLVKLREGGVLLSVGHSDATYEQAMAAFGGGIALCTHLYNAMSAFAHREPGLVGAVFSSEQVYAPIILDGIHCHYDAARIAYHQKGDKLFLISDALFLGKKKKEFTWDEFDATLQQDRYVNRHGALAGGAISLADAVVNAVRRVGIPLAEAVDMVTARPARALGMHKALGSLAPGYPAVFTSFQADLSGFNVLTL